MIEMRSLGFVSRTSPNENERDRSLVSKIVFDQDLVPGLKGIEEWSHIYVMFWMDRMTGAAGPELYDQVSGVGVLAARSPIHPNPLGLTLVELVKRDENVLWVRGLDALDGTPVVDIKPYPDWENGEVLVVTDFKVPGWLTEILDRKG